MYGLTRGVITLLGAAVAGFLIWLATQVSDGTNGGYWAVYGLIAAAGLTMALSQSSAAGRSGGGRGCP